MQGQGIVRRRIVHENQCMRWHVGESLLGAPCREEGMMPLAVRVPCFPGALTGQCCARYPAALGHRLHNDQPLPLPCRRLYPRTIFL
jgi:hypothetical protein